MERLRGRVCVVAGGGGALGEAVATRFRQEGVTVVGLDLKRHSIGDLALETDLADEDQVRSAYAQIWAWCVHAELLFLKLPALFLNPWSKSCASWADEDDQAIATTSICGRPVAQ